MQYTSTYRVPRFTLLCGVIFAACLLHGIAQSEDACDTTAAPSLPEAAFAILKDYDAHALTRITPTVKDVYALSEMEANDGKPLSAEKQRQAPVLVTRCLYQAVKSLIAVRASTEEDGFDWSSAKLIGASVGSKRYDPKSKDRKVDIVLSIESKGTSIDVTLDDCFLLNGRRLMADGFRMR